MTKLMHFDDFILRSNAKFEVVGVPKPRLSRGLVLCNYVPYKLYKPGYKPAYKLL